MEYQDKELVCIECKQPFMFYPASSPEPWPSASSFQSLRKPDDHGYLDNWFSMYTMPPLAADRVTAGG